MKRELELKKRQLSEFMTHELLFDFQMGHLDSDRFQLIQEQLKSSQELTLELEKIQSGISYFNHLADTKVSSALLERISGQVEYWSQLKKIFKFENWPPFVKWGFEAVSVISMVIAISILIPWTQIKEILMQESKTDLILAEVTKSPEQRIADETSMPEPTQHQGQVQKNLETPPATPEATSKVAAGDQKPLDKPATKLTEKTSDESKGKGFVFRGVLKIKNVQAGTPALKEKIVEMGGRKAGEVELGWRRNQGDYYFHFVIPEEKIQELESVFKSLGTYKINKDPHPRIMPSGSIRYIITTEESQE